MSQFSVDTAEQGQMLSAEANPFRSPEQQAALNAQRVASGSFAMAQDLAYTKEREAERAERYDLQNIVNRQTAMHAALMLGCKPVTAEELIAASGQLLTFLTAKD